MGALVDTSLLIDCERRARETATYLGQLLARTLAETLDADEDVAISAVTAAELLHGVHRATSQLRPQREAFVEGVLAAIPTMPFDLRAARTHARIWTDLAAAGSDIGPHDRIIAATAISLGWRVLTANARHFAAVPGLGVLTPVQRPTQALP